MSRTTVLAVGNGAWQGSIAYLSMAEGLRRGYATSSTDTGHVGGSASFGMGHSEKVTDFAYRAVHEMTVAAKAIVNAFYGRAATRAYWNGCSAGGRQAMKAAQMFPADYDGIIAGSPGLDWTGRSAQAVRIAQALQKPEARLTPTALQVLHTAVVAACDGIDGVKDGLLENPSACTFDPRVLDCTGTAASACLTPAQVDTVRLIYSPIARDPQLKPFFERGGKLLQYHGWSDPQITPLASSAYYDRVAAEHGGVAAIRESYRLFMAPGMAHCSGGEGPNDFDKLKALEQWVEQGQAPDRILASHIKDGKVDRTRPLCPYPQVASYTGTGSIDEAANFVCK